ncbi:MAG: hypothetical protein WCK02_16975 [Bacteroidota bacterium]
MKKLTTLLILIGLSFSVLAQKLDKQDLNFDYTKLPNQPFNKGIKNYTSNVVMVYEADIIAKKKANQDEYDKAKAEYPKKVTDAENEYKKAMDKYKTDKEAWDKKSFGDKIVEKKLLNENNKPVEPQYYKPSEPYFREIQALKVFDKNMLSTTYLKLDGFNNSTENAVKITATLYGFESLEPELKQEEGSEYNTQTKSTVKYINYWYQIQYKHPIGIKVELPTGEVLMDETPQEFSQYSKYKTNVSKGSQPSLNKEAILAQLQNSIVEQNMKIVSELINSKYGYQSAKRNSIIYRIEPKKFTYDDFQEAFENAVAGYGLLASDQKSGTDKLNISIGLWEKALTEFNPAEKKIRVDEDVARAARFNLAEAYIWTNNFEKADAQLTKIIGLNPSKKEEKAMQELREILKDQKARWIANNK